MIMKKERNVDVIRVLGVVILMVGIIILADTYFDFGLLDGSEDDFCYEVVDGIKEIFDCRDNFEVEKHWKANRPVQTEEDGSGVTKRFYYED